MAVCFALVLFAAIGIMSVLWALLGWLLPSGQGMVVVCLEPPDPGVLSRYRWLRGLGLLRCPLVAVTGGGTPGVPADVEICSREELPDRLEREKKRTYGTGTGNSAGRGQRRDLSEL